MQITVIQPGLIGNHWHAKGDVIDVDDERAKTLIARKQCELIKGVKQVKHSKRTTK